MACTSSKNKITLLRVIPTMTFIHFVTGKSSDILSDISSDMLSGISYDILSDIFSHILPVEVRQCPLRSGSRSWGPAVPTAIWKSRLRSGSAHWDLELAVEVRQCPLGSGARGGGPAVPTGIWTARRRRRVRRRRWRRRRRRTALIKSNNPHLAGGEKLDDKSITTWPVHYVTSLDGGILPKKHHKNICLWHMNRTFI